MGKYYGPIGFAETYEASPGVWKERIVERYYVGDVWTYGRNLENSQNINDDIAVTNPISIIADSYALHHFSSMRYIKWLDQAWKIARVDVEPPRLTLTLGGPYNGDKNWTTRTTY